MILIDIDIAHGHPWADPFFPMDGQTLAAHGQAAHGWPIMSMIQGGIN